MATLVRAIGDIKKRQKHYLPANASAVPVLPWHLERRTAAVAGVVIGVLLGLVVWANLSSPDNVTAAQPKPTQSEVKEPVNSPIVAAATVGPSATVVPAPAIVPPASTASSPDRSPKRTPDRSAERNLTRTPARTPESAPARTPAPTPLRTPEPDSAPARTSNAVAPAGYVGTLSITAEPSGDVYIDRQKVGRTPQSVENLRAGSHLVWIESEGYQRFTRVVQVPANRVSRLSVELQPVPVR